MSPMARLDGSAFLGVDLQPCKTMTDTLAPVERANWGVASLEFYPRPEWCLFGLVGWSGPSGGDWCPRVFTWGGVFPPPSPPPTPTCPSPSPTHPPPCNAELKLMHTCEKIV